MGTIAIMVTLFLTVFLSMPPAWAAEQPFEIVPHWVRPGSSVTVQLGPEVNAASKTFLRLSSRTTIKDFPLDFDQQHRRVVEVKIPATMRAGTYETSLVDEQGDVQGGHGSLLKIAASDKVEEKPVVTKIVPVVSYAVNGRYNFDIIGENFGDDVRGLKILVNDTVIPFEPPQENKGSETVVKNCGDNGPCLTWGWKKLSLRGFSLKGLSLSRPMTLSVAIDGIESTKQTLVLSAVNRATPVMIALAALGLFTALVYSLSRRSAAQYRVNGKSYRTLAYICMDPETNTFSLSRLQLILWSAASLLAYVYLAASQSLVQWNWAMCEVPANLPSLLGISAGTAVLSMGATAMRGSKGAGPVHPKLGDFITSGGMFAPERLQFFLWTVIGVFSFVCATLVQDPATMTELPKIPESFIPLMGLSSLGYLAGKVTRKPGPIITQLDPPPPYSAGPTTIKIVGDNLSPRAQVLVNGVLLAADERSVDDSIPVDTEFVRELLIEPVTIAPAVSGVAMVKIINPDGQSAEK